MMTVWNTGKPWKKNEEVNKENSTISTEKKPNSFGRRELQF
jgi:hypothetical protein